MAHRALPNDARLRELHGQLGIPSNYPVERGLPFHAEASELVEGQTDPSGRKVLLAPLAAQQWGRMQDQAKQAGITLLLAHGFRSYAEQAALLAKQISRGQTICECLTWIAAPGYSEHHSGRALDIGSSDCYPIPRDASFENTTAFRWLSLNAGCFGFKMSYPRGNRFGIIYEPWHWFLVGTA